MVDQSELDRLRREGRQRRRMTKVERHRLELADVVDTGTMSDEDVEVCWAAYTGARQDPVDVVR